MNMDFKKQRIRIGDTSKAILGLVCAVGVVSVLAMMPGAAMVIAPFIRKKKKYPTKQAIQKSVDALIKGGLLKKKVTPHGDIQIVLTRRGKWEAFLHSNIHDSTHTKWNGEWRIVMFDIPEKKQNERKELRRAMELFGFRLLQKSVWVYPYACDDFVALIKHRLGVSHDVLYMKVSYIENDAYLRKEFNL